MKVLLAVAFLALLWLPHAASAETLGHLVLRCAPEIAPRTALAIISVESGGSWYAVNDNDRAAPSFESPEAAIAYAERRVAEGGNIDLGLAQLNSAHLAEFHVTVREAFEPCTNVALGMDVLHDAWMKAQVRWGMTATALFHAFEGYNGGPGSWETKSPELRSKIERYAREVWATASGISFVPALPKRTALKSLAIRVHRMARARSPHRVTVFYQAPNGWGV